MRLGVTGSVLKIDGKINQTMFGNTKILIFTLILILIALVVLVVTRLLGPQKPPSEIVATPIPSPTSFIIPQTPTPIPTQVTNPIVPFASGAADKLLQKVQNPEVLSEADLAIRIKLTDSLGNNSGILNQTEIYRAEYVKSPDKFMVEILTTNIDLAKQEAINWFKGQGLSGDGICKLPIIFYLNYEVKNQLSGGGTTFNPLPEGC